MKIDIIDENGFEYTYSEKNINPQIYSSIIPVKSNKIYNIEDIFLESQKILKLMKEHPNFEIPSFKKPINQILTTQEIEKLQLLIPKIKNHYENLIDNLFTQETETEFTKEEISLQKKAEKLYEQIIKTHISNPVQSEPPTQIEEILLNCQKKTMALLQINQKDNIEIQICKFKKEKSKKRDDNLILPTYTLNYTPTKKIMTHLNLPTTKLYKQIKEVLKNN